MATHPIRVTVNGAAHAVAVDPAELLVDTLRERLGLAGTKVGCGDGVCGACTVLVDGLPRSSCLTLTVTLDGSEVVTVEGAPEALPAFEELAACVAAEGGVQCGYCTPGQLLCAAFLLSDDPGLEADGLIEGMSGNLCRCTGSYGILRGLRAFQAGRRS